MGVGSRQRLLATGLVHRLNLPSLHRLEFDVVVVVAPNGYFGDPGETQNRRKLLYVALTRAKSGAMLLKLG